MPWSRLLFAVVALVLAATSSAVAQGVVLPCYFVSAVQCQVISQANPLPVNATTSISGFTAVTTGTPISVTTSNSTGTLPAGAVVVATNVGATNAAYCALGATATTSSQYLSPGGGWFAFTVGASTQLTCITSSSTTTVNMTGGAGLPTGTGGGGGGVSSTVTANAGTNLNTSALMLDATGQSILTAVGNPIPTQAPTVNIGAIGISQTTDGTTNLVRLSAETTKVIGTVNQGTSPWVVSGTVTASGVAQGSTTSGQTGSLVQCAVTTSAPSYTTAQTDPLSCDTTGNLRVTGAVTLAANQSVNVAQIAGTTTATGSGVMTAGTQRTALATDSPGIITLGQTTKSAGVPIAFASDQVGTAGTANATVLTVQGIASMTKLLVTPDSVALPSNQSVNVSQINGVTPLMGNGATGTGSPRVTVSNDNTGIATWGQGATAATAPSGATQAGCRAQNAEATAVTNGQMAGHACDLVGKLINLPYANPENGLNGQITTAMTGTTTTAVTGMGAQGAGVRNYVTACTFSNSHATVGTMILLQDGSGGTTLWQAPAASAFGGSVVQFPTPIKTTANTALFAANVTTGANTFVSCTGYKGI